MSAYVTCQTEYRDEESLVHALEDLGYTVETHAGEGANLYGYKGDMRAQKAHVIVRRQYVGGASNDVGFVRVGSGYQAIISEYDQSTTFTPRRQAEIKAKYAYHQVLKSARAKGYTLASEASRDGKVKLTLRRFS